jgi:hypothetical protein
VYEREIIAIELLVQPACRWGMTMDEWDYAIRYWRMSKTRIIISEPPDFIFLIFIAMRQERVSSVFSPSVRQQG